MATYRVGIAGCGRKASTIDDERRWLTNYDRDPCSHLSAYRACPQTEVVAAAAPSEGSRARFRERWGVERLYSDYQEMLAVERLDIVSVATHASLHAEVSVAAAEAGAKGVLCEKAIATSLEEAARMRAACRAGGTRLLVNHPRRYHPTYQNALMQVRDGEIGELKMMLGSIYTALVHNGSHLFDMFRMFAGEAAWVSGLTEAGEGDVGGRAQLGFQSGVAAYADVASMQGFELQLLGTHGRIHVHSFREGFERWIYRPRDPDPKQTEWFQFGPGKDVDATFFLNDLEVEAPPMLAAVQDLIASIEQGREPLSSGRDGEAALEMALAVHASSANGGARVDLPLTDRRLRVVSR